MKKLLFLVAFLAIAAFSFAQVVTPFVVRKTVTQKGGIVFLSNTASKAVPDNIVQNENPPSGTGYNNNYTNGYVDIDGDAATWMSSSDQLNLAGCSEITWAGLYWGADCSTGDENFATRSQVKLKVNSGSYIDLTADYIKDNTTGYRTYHCFKDITSILKANGLTDRYTIANVATDIGGKNLFGGWTIVVIYKNNTENMKNLTVFEGLASVSASGAPTVDIPISGFQTPLSGPVNFELGLVVYDGDRSLTGDQLMFKGVSTFLNLSDALHPIADVFNSTLSRKGVLTSLRNPSYNNTLGYDANIFTADNSAKNYIGNNAISATIRQTTGGETFLTQVVTSAIDVYEPDLRSAVRVKNITNPGASKADPGDILEYTVNGLNIGSDPSVNTFITDTIEGNAFYIPGSLQITYGPNIGALTDEASDDQGEYISSSKVVKVRIGTGANAAIGGKVMNSPVGTDSTEFKFRVQVTNDCVYLYCDSVINNSAHIVGTGNVSGNTFDNASNPGVFDAFGCPIPGTTQTPIKTNGCSRPAASANTPVCLGGTLTFTVTDSPSATYSWTGPNSFTSTLREPSITNVSSSNSGIYTAHIFITGTACHFLYPFDAEINVANAGPDQSGSTTCGQTTATLAANKPTGTTGVWTIISGTGGSFADNTNPITAFSGVAGNSYTLRWTLNSPGCPSTNDDVVITFNQGPTASVLSGTASICYNNYANLKVNVSGGVSPYTVSINNSGGIYTNYTSGNDLIVGPLTSSTTFGLISVTDANGCSSSGLSGSAIITVSDAISGTMTFTQNTAPSSGSVGPNLVGTIATSGSNYTWSSTANIKTIDNLYATQTISGNNTPQTLNLTNLGFSIPTSATINGIEVVVDRHYTTTGSRYMRDKTIQLLKSGSTAGNNKALTSTSWPLTTDATVTYPSSGGSTDLWGTTWTPADINASTFGLRFTAQRSSSGSGNPTGYLDYITIKVYYTTSYCDNATSQSFTISSLTNATSYTWTPPSGGSIVSGQGTTTALMDFNGAGQSGNYNICVTPSNNCQTATSSCLSIPISDCANTGNYIIGNVYWDPDGSAGTNLVNGTGIGSANATQLYMTLKSSAGTTALQNSTAVGSDGIYKISVSASTSYKIVLSKNSYTTGQTVAAPALPSGCTFNGEIANNVANTLTGNDGTIDGILSVTSLASNNVVNANFGIKISTPPVAVNDVTSTSEDTQVTKNVTTNDTDVDGTVSVSTVDLDPSTAGTQTTITNIYGTWTVNSSGVVTYTPASNFNGNASVNYTVNDNDGNTSNIGTLFVSVAAVNDPPIASNHTITVDENSYYTFASSDFPFTDAESNSMVSITISTLPATGTLTLNGVAITAGQTITLTNISGIVFTPLTNGHGSPYASFNFYVNDLSMGTLDATLTINVPHVNVAPLAVKDEATTNQNVAVAINLLTNDINADGTLLTNSVDLDPLTAGQQTSLTITNEGTYTDNGSGIITFTPLSTFYGTTTAVRYTVDNSVGLSSNQAVISITVIPAGAPVAVDDAASTNENTSVTINVSANDTDDGTLNLSRIDLDPATPGIQQSYYVSGKGQFSVDITGIVTFVPDWNYYGTVTCTYTIKDDMNYVSNVATITVTVNWVNSAPFAVDDNESTNEDTPLTFNVLSNDYDLDGTIDVASVDLDLNTSGRQTTFTLTGQGTFTVDNSGNVTFTPLANYNGTVSAKGYTITDNLGLVSDSAIMIITINSVNDLPIANNDVITAPSGQDVTKNIVSNDSDPDGTIDATSVDLNPSFPGIQKTFTVSGEGTYTVDNSGMVTFVPLVSFVGPVTATAISYTVNDNSGGTSNSATLTITLSDPSGPVAVNDNTSLNEDGSAVTIDVTANDLAGSGNINVATIDLDPSTAGQQTSYATSLGSFSLNTSTGIVTFTPTANAYGSVTISYLVYDDNATPIASNVATITVTVNSVNDVPSFTKGANQVVCANSGVHIVSGWATSMSVGPANESSQSYSFTATNNNNSLFDTQPYLDTDGTLYYTLAVNQSGVATVSVKIKDDGGTANSGVDESAIQTFTITVNGVTVPAIGAITQPTCGTITGSVVLSDLPSSGSWTLNYGSGLTQTGSGNTYTLSNLTASTIYNFTVTNASGCTSNASADANILVVPSAPSVPTVSTTTQPTCGTPSGTIVFTSQSGVEYSVGSGYQASATFSGLSAGSYTLSVRSTTDNTCITNAASTVTINAVPSAPSVPTVSTTTQPTCGTPSGTIVFTSQSGVQYSVGSGYQASATFSGLSAGSYTLSVRSTTDNTCITNAASTVTINAVPSAPSVPTVSTTTQPTCGTPSGTIVFTSQSGVQYSVGSGYQASATFSGLSAGSYTLSVRSTTDNTCFTNAASTVTINAVPSAPSVPTVSTTTQPTCGTPSGTIVFTSQSGVEYSVGSGYQASATFSGLSAGSYTLSVRSTTDNTCITNAASTVTINAVPSAPSVPTVSTTTQPTCGTPSGTIVFTSQSGVQYSVGSGYQASATFSGLSAGSYTLSVRSTTDNTCITNAASTVTINAVPSAPSVPTVSTTTQPTCGTPSGTIVFTSQSGVEYSVGSGYQASATFSGLSAGSYTLSVRSTTDNTCITNAASTVTINAVPSAPTVPTVSTTTQPTCGTPSGTIVFTSQSGVQYSIGSGYQASATFSGLSAGSYTLSVRSTTDNTCITNAASTVTINAVPSAPSVPTVSTTTQPTCGTPSGTIVFTSQSGVQYSVGSGYQASATFSGLSAGSYTLSVRSTTDNTCITNAASTVTINAVPSAPSVPTVSTTTQPTCGTPSGTIVFTSQSGVQYSVGSGYQASATFSGLSAGSYTLSVRSTTDNTCITNAASTVTINAVPSAPSVPTVSTTTQPTCGTPSGTIVFTSQSGMEYSIGAGYQSSEIFTGLAPGSYNLAIRNSSDYTCLAAGVSPVSIDDIPTPPDAPIAASTQNFCSGNTPIVSDMVVSGNNIQWYDASTGGNLVAGSTLLGNGLTYYATQTNGDCESLDRTGVTVTILSCTGPEIINDTISLDENTPSGSEVIDVNDDNTKVDTDNDSNPLTYTIEEGNDLGGFTIDPATGKITVADSTQLDYEKVKYFILKVRATNGTIYDEAFIVINIRNLNDNAPQAIADSYSLNEGDTLNIVIPGVLVNDSDPDGDVVTTLLVNGPLHGNIIINPDGSFSYIHDGGESIKDSISYVITDGKYNSDTVKVIFTIQPINDPPVIADIDKTMNEDEILKFSEKDFTDAYTDQEDSSLVKIRITSLPLHGVLMLLGEPISLNDEIELADLLNITFQPDTNWNGSTSFQWFAFDGTDYSVAGATVNITVNQVNDSPVIEEPEVNAGMDEDGDLPALDVLTGVTDEEGNNFTPSVEKQPTHGKVTIDGDGKLKYQPDENFYGQDTIYYQICDDGSPSKCSEGKIIVTVNPVNDPPVLSEEIIRKSMDISEGQKTIDILSNVSDADGDHLSPSIVNGPKHGTAELDLNGNLVYTPASGYLGNDTITYEICDDGNPSLCVSGMVVITITETVNNLPVVSDFNKTSVQDKTIQFMHSDFTVKYTDADQDPLVKIRFTVLPVHGKLQLNGVDILEGQEILAEDLDKISFIPEKGFYGEVSIGWEASDGKGYSAEPALITIVITPSDVFIPEGFSPNGDGINDYFVIQGADKYLVTLRVFNRWGNLVYESKHYQNDWDGVANEGILLSNKLPDGTYYYSVNFNNGEKEKVGFITINR